MHPNALNDLTWGKIIDLILVRKPFIVNLPANDKAEKHIIQSKVIVGDVSTVLWWSSFFNKKIIISFDIFNYPGGDDMKYYEPFIKYINNLDEEFQNFNQYRCLENKSINQVFS